MMPFCASYLFIFLPLFMGIYTVLPKNRRSVLISAANIFFAALSGAGTLILCAVCLLCGFFSGIGIYNYRTRPDKIKHRKALFILNMSLNAGVLVFEGYMTASGGLSRSGVLAIGGAVLPLHMISYITDVYRGTAEAQTSFTALTAYAWFFPSMHIGPVLRYSRFSQYFKAPVMSRRRMSRGIMIYIAGLAEYLLISRRLYDIWNDMLSVPKDMRGAASIMLSSLIWYTSFLTCIAGMLHMGQGTALMLGFPVKKPIRRRLVTDDLHGRLLGYNVHITSWMREYIYRPIAEIKGKGIALTLSVCAVMMWYSFNLSWLCAGLVCTLLMMLQSFIVKKAEYPHKFLYTVMTKLFTAAAAAVPALSALWLSGGFPKYKFGFNENDTETFFFLISESWLPLLLGLVATGSVLPVVIKRINSGLLKLLMPVAEVILLLLCTAYMINI